MEQNNQALKTALTIIGFILIIIVSIWGRAGFYMKDLPVMGIILIAGLICIIIAQKMKVKKNNAEGLPLSDKWKCSCGSYNGKADAVYWNCGARNFAPQPVVSNNYSTPNG